MIIYMVYDPSLANLAKNANCDKMICRKCYARLPLRSKQCRKKNDPYACHKYSLDPCGKAQQLLP